jgi:hypothetical protein
MPEQESDGPEEQARHAGETPREAAQQNFLFDGESDDVSSDSPMQPSLTPGTRWRRVVLWSALAVVLAAAAATTGALLGSPLASAKPTPMLVPGPGETPAASAIAPVVPAPAERPRPAPVAARGRVLDDKGAPLRGAAVTAAGLLATTDLEGRFALGPVEPGVTATIKLPGYQKVLVALDGEVDARLKPHSVRAAYLSYFGFADRGIRERVLAMAAGPRGINGVVIDVKGDRGWIPYRTEVPLALAAGAQGPVIMKDMEGFLADLKGRGFYTIARIVVFKDNILANHKPDLAIIDTRTGKPWIDNEKLAWVDPTREEVWDYAIAVAKEAARKGFDEVQFDYVRFPTDGRLSAARYSKPNNQAVRLETIAGFLARAKKELTPLGVFVAADVFGYTAFNENDTDIGQRIEEIAPHLDYISPMVYPSGYHVGIPGVRNPVNNPYEIVKESVRLTRKRANASPVVVRPWLQDFRDYAFDRRIFGVREIQAQIRGADDGGAQGWMLWNPRNDYTAAALRPETVQAAKRAE